MFLSYLITALISLSTGFAIAIFLYRRGHKRSISLYLEYESRLAQKEKELTQIREALQTIMYRTHHHEVNPRSKRIRGLCNLGYLAISRSDDQESLSMFRYIEAEALALETDTLQNVKEFEHLQ